MILFKPVGRSPEIFAFNGATMSQPLSSNAFALNSSRVFLIFAGPNWQQNGAPTGAVNQMIASAQAILSSSYLSGLIQYGSDGRATYGGFTIDTSLDPLTWSKDYLLSNGTIDHTTNPVWFETDKILSDPNFSSWRPSGGDARNSPIYVVVRYSHDGTGAGGGYGGSNSFGPNDYTAQAVNVIDVSITSADQVDQFSWVFSHEIVERMSTGTGNQVATGVYEVSPDGSAQIADGEPESNEFLAWRLNGSTSPMVTSYWSVLDQAFIIPDGELPRTLLVPVWSSNSWTGKCLSLEAGNLYEAYPPYTRTLIDSEVQSYAVLRGPGARIFDVTAGGQVREYSGSGTNWAPVTGSNTVAGSLVAQSTGRLYMIASNNNTPNRVWQYTGAGTSWIPITGGNTSVSAIAVAGDRLYMLASNDGGNQQVWRYDGSGTDWTPVTGTNTLVYSMAAADETLYIMADNDHGPRRVWQYSGSGTDWTPITGTTTKPVRIATAGDVLCMLAANGNGPNQVWQYALAPDIWTPLTGTNTSVVDFVVQDGIQLYALAANSGGINLVWQYDSTPNRWSALTGTNTNASAIGVASNNRLHMHAANDGGAFRDWIYDGTPGQWTPV